MPIASLNSLLEQVDMRYIEADKTGLVEIFIAAERDIQLGYLNISARVWFYGKYMLFTSDTVNNISGKQHR